MCQRSPEKLDKGRKRQKREFHLAAALFCVCEKAYKTYKYDYFKHISFVVVYTNKNRKTTDDVHHYWHMELLRDPTSHSVQLSLSVRLCSLQRGQHPADGCGPMRRLTNHPSYEQSYFKLCAMPDVRTRPSHSIRLFFCSSHYADIVQSQ